MENEKLESGIQQKLVVDEEGAASTGSAPKVDLEKTEFASIPSSGNRREPALVPMKGLKSRRVNKDGNLSPQSLRTRRLRRWLMVAVACVAIVVLPVIFAVITVVSHLDPSLFQNAMQDWPTQKQIWRKTIAATSDYDTNQWTNLSRYGEVLMQHQEYAEALKVFKHCDQITQRSKNWQVYNALQIATCAHKLHEDDASIELPIAKVSDAIKIGKTLKGEEWRTAALTAALGDLYADQGDFKTAEQYYDEAERLYAMQANGAGRQGRIRGQEWRARMWSASNQVAAISKAPATTLVTANGDSKVGEKALKLLHEKNYNDLEKLYRTSSTNRVQTQSGHETVDNILDALSTPDALSPSGWSDRLHELELWVTARPKSAAARVALADFYIDYAWDARGTGWSSSVSNTQRALFKDRLYLSSKQLQEALALGAPSPEWFRVAQVNMLGAGNRHDQKLYDAITNSGIRLYPNYAPLYLNKVYYLQPRWHGKGQEWVDFAGRQADSIGGAKGDMLYAQMVQSVESLYSDIYKEAPNLSRERVKRGTDLLNKQFHK